MLENARSIERAAGSMNKNRALLKTSMIESA